MLTYRSKLCPLRIYHIHSKERQVEQSRCPAVGWLGLNGPLRKYFSLHVYRAVFQREGERKEKWQTGEKISKRALPAPTASAVGPCPTLIQSSRSPRYWKFPQLHRTTRPPPLFCESVPIYLLLSNWHVLGWLDGAMVMSKLWGPGRPTNGQ